MPAEASLSKYARKQLAKERGTWTPPTVPVPAPSDPEEPESEFADLGTLPCDAQKAFDGAAYALRRAAEICQHILNRARPGIQKAEPLSLRIAATSMARKAKAYAARAERIINATSNPCPTGEPSTTVPDLQDVNYHRGDSLERQANL